MNPPSPTAPPRIIVIGGGTMGAGIAAGFMAHACDVVLLVRDAAHCETTMQRTATLADSVAPASTRGALSAGTLDTSRRPKTSTLPCATASAFATPRSGRCCIVCGASALARAPARRRAVQADRRADRCRKPG